MTFCTTSFVAPQSTARCSRSSGGLGRMIYLNAFQLGLEVAFLTAPYVAVSFTHQLGAQSMSDRLNFTSRRLNLMSL